MHAPATISTAALLTAVVLAVPAQATFGPDSPYSTNPVSPTNRGGFCFGPDCIPGPFGATQSSDCNHAGSGNPVPLFPEDRYSSYSGFSSSLYRFGAYYSPTDSLTLRGTYGTSFRAPNLQEQFFGSTSGGLDSTGDDWSNGLTMPMHAYRSVGDELPKDSFGTGLSPSFGPDEPSPFIYPGGDYQFKVFPPADAVGGYEWPGAGLNYAEPGADRDPLFGSFGSGGRTSFNQTDWDWLSRYSMYDSYLFPANRYSSVNFQTPPGGVPQQFQPFVSQQFGIGDVDWTSLTFDADYLGNFSNALDEEEIEFEINGCRYKLVPTDPNFVQSGRGSWGQAEDDQWAIKRVGLTADEDSAWNQVPDDATPVVVAVVDTGLDWHHLDISADNIWNNANEIPDNGIDDDNNGYVDDWIGWDFYGRNNKPWDFDGHGTVVAGIIAATQDNGVGIAGINPHAKLMVLKAVNNFGNSRPSYLAEAIVYAADNGARIINLSVGGPRASKMEQAAIAYAHSKGVLIVAASGNEGIELDDYGPAGADNVLTVGATFTDDRAAAFSNYGDKVDLVAPGVDVLSLRARYTDANYRPDNEDEYAVGTNYVGEDKRYIHVSGTSFAAPIVTGIASLVMAKSPEMTAAEVEELLLQTAEDIESPGKDQYSGFGLVNAKAALGVEGGFFVAAEISGVDPLETDSGTVLQVKGTIDSDDFKRAWMQIGAGDNPAVWKAVGQKRKYPIHDGVLGTVPLSEFAGADVWQIVMNVEHKNGVQKSARYRIRLN